MIGCSALLEKALQKYPTWNGAKRIREELEASRTGKRKVRSFFIFLPLFFSLLYRSFVFSFFFTVLFLILSIRENLKKNHFQNVLKLIQNMWF